MALDIPTAEDIFDKPYAKAAPIPSAWTGEFIAVELVNRECARLIANCLFEPPITENEIDRYAQRFEMTRRQAELEIRRGRDGDA